MKAVIFHSYVIVMIISLMAVNSTIIPLVVSLFFMKPVWKMMSGLSDDEIYRISGVKFIQSLSDNPVIKDINKE